MSILGHAVALVAATWGGALFAALRTGDERLDRVAVRGLVAAWMPILAWREYRRGPAYIVRLARAYMAIIYQESRGDHSAVGDREIRGGPSVGLGQVLRRTALDLGLWTDPTPGLDGDDEERRAYEEMRHHPSWQVAAGISVYLDKLHQARRAGPDPGWDEIWSAVRRYNGSGPAAEAYRKRAYAWARARWGDEV